MNTSLYITTVIAELSPAILLSIIGILGLVVGSFLNVLIRRLPIILEHKWLRESRMMDAEAEKKIPSDETQSPLSLALPPSHCFSCKKKLKLWHKVPILSYLLLRGHCEFCKNPIGRQYPVVELLALFTSVVIVSQTGLTLQSLAALLLSWLLIALAFIDFNEKLLPDELTLTLLWVGLIVNSFELFISAEDAIFGAIAGYAALWIIYQGMRLATGRQGLGYGDMKLLAAIGAWCGWQALPFILLMASSVGLIVSAILLIMKKMKKDEQIPFGPYLSIASWLFFTYRFIYEPILTWPPF